MTGAFEDTDGEPIGRCYTKARRTPLVVGSVPGGDGRSLRLPFGPYTLTQLAAIVLTTILLVLSRPVWGGHGLTDVLILVAVPFAAAAVLRHLHIDGRNPAAAAASIAVMLTGPRWGRLHGRPYRPPRAHHTSTVITVKDPHPPTATDPAAPPALTAPHTARATAESAPPRLPAREATGRPVASGVQALLVHRTATHPSREE